MHVLNLVTNDEAQFFTGQRDALARRGVTSDTVAVPGERTGSDGRSVLDYLRFYPRVLRASRREYDLVHANYGLTGPAALAQPIRPVVLSLWGSDLHGWVGRLSRACARRADAVVVMSDAMAADVGTDAFVVPHGVDRATFRPMPREPARRAVGWPADAANVLFPYSPERPVKDFPRAQRIVERARREADRPIDLQTIDGVPHDRMPLYYNAADALLITSTHEGSPNSVKEALSCALPVVATDVGDVRERVAGVTPSTVADSDDALVAGLLEAIDAGRSNGRAAIGDLGRDRMAAELEAIYRRVC
ncbi:glycosyl transferase [Halococcoides cellulosivorans]|uniref:Glycosyl transferase n=2 Tax=Halococcoides cellulosivorans TaxID=1679096 RepID=A0A2R4X3I6_9EURY|nr:glycosyl transferase [Halococcoides cellulosivorans]